MRQAAALLGAAFLLLAAPASAELAAVSPPQKVTSKDGGLTVSVPRGALTKNVRVRIRVLARAQYPPELRNATFRPGSKLYALEPAGLRFVKPVTITRRIDTKVSGFDPKDGLPTIVLTTTSNNGKWEILTGHSMRLTGDTLVIQARTRHFSTLVALDGSYRMSLVPPAVDLVVGQTFVARVETKSTSSQPTSQLHREIKWFADGAVLTRRGSREGEASIFQCIKAGTGSYSASVSVEDIDLIVSAITLGTRGYSYTSLLKGIGRCRAAPPTRLELAFACVVVAHSPLGSYPSFTRWLLRVTGQLPSNAQASLTAGGVNGGQPIGGTMNLATGAIEFTGGISSFGQKPVQNLAVAGQNLTQQLVDKVGTPNVTAAQGTIAGQCPP